MLTADNNRRRTEGVLGKDTGHGGGRVKLNKQHVQAIGLANARANRGKPQPFNGNEVIDLGIGQVNGHWRGLEFEFVNLNSLEGTLNQFEQDPQG